jgi:hypothetical protein
VVKQKRHKELEVEFNAREKLPILGLKNFYLLKQARQTCTLVIFQNFHNEYDYSSAMIIKYHNDSQLMHEYIVGFFNESKEYKVVCDHVNKIISCSCRKFETFEISCCYTLKNFKYLI